jgi:hypothetical protein
MGAGFRLEVVAEVRGVLVALLFGGGLLTMLGVAHVVFDAQLADVQFGIAGVADVEAAQRQRSMSMSLRHEGRSI